MFIIFQSTLFLYLSKDGVSNFFASPPRPILWQVRRQEGLVGRTGFFFLITYSAILVEIDIS